MMRAAERASPVVQKRSVGCRVDAPDQRFRQPAHDLPRDRLARIDELHARADDLRDQRPRNG